MKRRGGLILIGVGLSLLGLWFAPGYYITAAMWPGLNPSVPTLLLATLKQSLVNSADIVWSYVALAGLIVLVIGIYWTIFPSLDDEEQDD